MTGSQMSSIITQYFRDNVSNDLHLITTFDNSPEVRPVSPVASIRCNISILDGESSLVEISSLGYRTVGVLVVKLIGDIERGDGPLRTFADNIRELFKNKNINGVHFRTPKFVNLGRVGNKWEFNVNCPFYYGD